MAMMLGARTGFIAVVSALVRSGLQKTVANKGVQIALGAAAVADVVNLDMLQQESLRITQGDPGAAAEAARTAARLLGLGGDEVLWPSHRKGARMGEPIIPAYITIDLTKGRAWYHSKYNSFKSVQAANRRGFRNGRRSGTRSTMAQARTFGRP